MKLSFAGLFENRWRNAQVMAATRVMVLSTTDKNPKKFFGYKLPGQRALRHMQHKRYFPGIIVAGCTSRSNFLALNWSGDVFCGKNQWFILT
jgi:hypothetical protein